MFQSGVLPCSSRRRGVSSCSTVAGDGGPAWTSPTIFNYLLTTISNQVKRLARSLAVTGPGLGSSRPQDPMQHSSPLLLPSRSNSNSQQQQHDDTSNQNNAQEKRYAGRKRKKKLTTLQDKVADATRLLKEQIAKANIITSQSHGPSAFSRHEDQQSPAESTSSGSRGERRPPSPFSPTTTYDVTNYNETDSNSYATSTSLFTSSESNDHHLLQHHHHLQHETRLPPSPSIEVMDISSPPTTGVTEFSSSPASTAVTDYSSPLIGVGYSSPPLEAMGYYSPPPLGPMDTSSPQPDMDMDDDDGTTSAMIDYHNHSPPPPPLEEPLSHFYHPPVHPVPSQPHFTNVITEKNKIDWGSDSEDEEDEDDDRPTPVTSSERFPESVQLPSSRIPEERPKSQGGSPGLIPSSAEDDEAQDLPEEEPVVPRTISESEVDRLHSDKLESLNGNYDSSGSFREWHETLRVQTYGGEELLILPYTVIDF